MSKYPYFACQSKLARLKNIKMFLLRLSNSSSWQVQLISTNPLIKNCIIDIWISFFVSQLPTFTTDFRINCCSENLEKLKQKLNCIALIFSNKCAGWKIRNFLSEYEPVTWEGPKKCELFSILSPIWTNMFYNHYYSTCLHWN